MVRVADHEFGFKEKRDLKNDGHKNLLFKMAPDFVKTYNMGGTYQLSRKRAPKMPN
jgi:hypothetical protein